MNLIIKNKLTVLILVLTLFSCKEKESKEVQTNLEAIEEINYLEESKEDFNKRMQWWRDATFGMFIHWGPYAVYGGEYNGKTIKGEIAEWIMQSEKIPIADYELKAKQFVPEKFNAREWVSLAKEAGIKYIVITSKHHDGFGIWNSEVSNYNIVDYTPYQKDILKELAKACKEQDLPLGFYYSILDWHHPMAQADTYIDESSKSATNEEEFATYFNDYLKVQLKELIENYDPEILWFDGEWVGEFSHEQGQELYQYVRTLKPSIIINNRVDKGRQGMQGMSKADKNYAGDFGTPEQEILEETSAFDWESCMTMNNSWGYKKGDTDWKSAETLIFNLVDVAAKGGNYLLNIGPTAEGLIPEPSVERLKAIGKWLDINGEGIYGTTKLDVNYKQGDNVRFTKKGVIIYAFTFERPKSTLILNNIQPESNSTIELLGIEEQLQWSYNDNKLTIKIPSKVIAKLPKSTAYTFKIKGKEL